MLELIGAEGRRPLHFGPSTSTLSEGNLLNLVGRSGAPQIERCVYLGSSSDVCWVRMSTLRVFVRPHGHAQPTKVHKIDNLHTGHSGRNGLFFYTQARAVDTRLAAPPHARWTAS